MSIESDLIIMIERVRKLENAHERLRWVAGHVIRANKQPDKEPQTLEFQINQLEGVLNDTKDVG